MSSIRWLVRWVLIIAVISTCALLTLTVGMTRAGSITDEGTRLGIASGTGDRAHRQNPVTERKVPPDSAVGIDRRTTPPVLVTVPNPGSRTAEETHLALAAVRFILSDNPAGDRGMESQAMAPRTLIRPGDAVTAIVSEATMATVKPPGDRCGPDGASCMHHTPTSRGSSESDSFRGGSLGSGRGCGPGHPHCVDSSGGDGRRCGPWNHYCGPFPGKPHPRQPHPEFSTPRVVKPPVAPIVVPPAPRVVVPPVVPLVEPPPPPVVKPPVTPVVEPPAPPVVKPPAPPVVEPPVTPMVKPPVTPMSFSKLIPWLWSMIVALILLGLGLLALLGLLAWSAVRGRQKQKWIHTHVQAIAGAAPGVDVEVMESRMDHSPPTRVVRLEPHADSGRQVLEEVHQ
jgi:hypothetical protein